MGAMASQITSLMIVYSTVYSGADKGNIKAPRHWLFVWGIHRWPVNSPQKWPVTRKMVPFDDVIMTTINNNNYKRTVTEYHCLAQSAGYNNTPLAIRHVALVAITGTTVLTPYLQISCRYFTWLGTSGLPTSGVAQVIEQALPDHMPHCNTICKNSDRIPITGMYTNSGDRFHRRVLIACTVLHI